MTIITNHHSASFIEALEAFLEVVRADAYQAAAIRLCHGLCADENGDDRVWHAWLEVAIHDPEINEQVTVVSDPSGPPGSMILRFMFYLAHDLTEMHVTRYTLDEAFANITTHNHLGPWQDENGVYPTERIECEVF